jgi:hypothetical protein
MSRKHRTPSAFTTRGAYRKYTSFVQRVLLSPLFPLDFFFFFFSPTRFVWWRDDDATSPVAGLNKVRACHRSRRRRRRACRRSRRRRRRRARRRIRRRRRSLRIASRELQQFEKAEA